MYRFLSIFMGFCILVTLIIVEIYDKNNIGIIFAIVILAIQLICLVKLGILDDLKRIWRRKL